MKWYVFQTNKLGGGGSVSAYCSFQHGNFCGDYMSPQGYSTNIRRSKGKMKELKWIKLEYQARKLNLDQMTKAL